MLSQVDIESKLRQIKPMLKDKFHVDKIGYFGSYASGKQTAQSDLDLLVELSSPVGWDYFMLEEYLEQVLGIRIDMVTPNALKDRIRESILKQVHYV